MTINKLYRAILLLCATVAVMNFLSCGTDEEDDNNIFLEIKLEEEIQPEEPAPPEPDWADGVMTITVGRFETKEEMLQELEESSFYAGAWTKQSITEDAFTITPPKRQYTIDIAVVTMPEAGMNEPATLAEIKEQYRKEGYDPLTPEEIIELRLQLHGQPETSTGHRMSAFFSLPTEEMKALSGGIPYVHIICHTTPKNGGNAPPGIIMTTCFRDGSRLFDPNDEDPFGWIGRSRHGVVTHPSDLLARFACAVRGTKKRK